MAKNWTLKEAIAEIRKGTDKAAMQDIASRYPLTAIAAATDGGLMNIITALPDKITARVIESVLKDGAPVDDESVSDEKEAAAEAVEEKKMEKKAAAKAKTKAKPEPVPEPESEVEDEEEEISAGVYDGMNAKQLFDECQKRGIKCLPRRKKEIYIELLKKNDEENSGDEEWDEADEDGWDEEEAPKEEAKKTEKKTAAKAKAGKATTKAKAKPEPEPTDDDDEDWDID